MRVEQFDSATVDNANSPKSVLQVRQMMAQLEQLCATSADQETMQTLKRSRIELQDVFMASETNAKKAIMGASCVVHDMSIAITWPGPSICETAIIDACLSYSNTMPSNPAELQRSVATERAAASELQTPLEQLSSQLEGLASKKGQLAAHIASMQQLKDTSAGAMQQLLAQTLQYKDMLAALQKDQGAQLPRTQ